MKETFLDTAAHKWRKWTLNDGSLLAGGCRRCAFEVALAGGWVQVCASLLASGRVERVCRQGAGGPCRCSAAWAGWPRGIAKGRVASISLHAPHLTLPSSPWPSSGTPLPTPSPGATLTTTPTDGRDDGDLIQGLPTAHRP